MSEERSTETASTRAPRVFISYAWGSPQHQEAVRDLWGFLRANGVDAQLDRVAAQRRQDWTLWMEQQINQADHVLVIASRAYRDRAGSDPDSDEGRGVQYEARLLRHLFYQNQQDLNRFLPVVLPGGDTQNLPAFLTGAITTVYQVSAFSVAGAEPLLRLLLGRPEEIEPVLGQPPDLPARNHNPVPLLPASDYIRSSTGRSVRVVAKLNGGQKRALRDVLLDAYTSYDDLAAMLDLELSRQLAHVAAPGSLPSVVLKLINNAEAEGWTAELVTGAAMDRPGNPQLRELIASGLLELGD